VYDFGENMAGLTALSEAWAATLPEGTHVTIRHSEMLNRCGLVAAQFCDWPACKPNNFKPAIWPDYEQGGNQANQTSMYITTRGVKPAPNAQDSNTTSTNTSSSSYYMPRFSYYGFRYAMIEGVPDGATPPTKDSLHAFTVATRVTPTGDIHFNQSMLNKIQRAVQVTQQSNLHSHPEDCPQR
jgi:hypothetical protein